MNKKNAKDEEFPNVSMTNYKMSNRYKDYQVRNFKNLYGDEKSISQKTRHLKGVFSINDNSVNTKMNLMS